MTIKRYVCCAACLFSVAALEAQQSPQAEPVRDTVRVIETRAGKVRADKMLEVYFRRWAGRLELNRKSKLSQLKTPADWQFRSSIVREYLQKVLGSPTQGNVLKPLVTGTMKGSGCRVEKILFQSRPSFYLTANLYLPENPISGGRYPAVIVHPGPYDNGKQTLKEGLHDRCAELASRGCAAITYDPIGQGERQQYHDPVASGIWWRPRPPAWRIYQSEKFDPELQDVPGTAVLERSMLAGQAFLLGRVLPADLVRDLSSVVDYLRSRTDIDSTSLFALGGGEASLALAAAFALDSRIKGLALGNCLPAFADRMAEPRPPSPVSCLPGSVDAGIGLWDILILAAPRPLWVEEAPPEESLMLEKAYSSLGAAERIEVARVHRGGMAKKTDWFAACRWLAEQTETEELRLEDRTPRLPTRMDSLKSGRLNVTETGQMLTSLVARTLHQIYREEAETRESGFKEKTALETDENLTIMKEKLGLERIISPPEFRVLSLEQRDGYTLERIVLTVEEDISLPAEILVPVATGKKHPGLIYLGDNHREYDVANGGYSEFLARQGYLVLTLDPRGSGSTAPGSNLWDEDGEFFAFLLGSQAQSAYRALELGSSLLELRIRDVAAAAAYLAARKDVQGGKIACRGYGELAPLALYSAFFIPEIKSVIYERGPVSFADMVTNGYSFFRPGSMLPGAVPEIDIAVVATAMAPRGVLLLNTVDACKVRLCPEEVRARLSETAERYSRLGRESAFRVTVADTPAERRQVCLEWLKNKLR